MPTGEEFAVHVIVLPAGVPVTPLIRRSLVAVGSVGRRLSSVISVAVVVPEASDTSRVASLPATSGAT